MNLKANKINFFDSLRIQKEDSVKIVFTWLIILASIFIICSLAFSQKVNNDFPKSIVINGQSCIAFDMEQSKHLAFINESYKECDSVLSITNNSLSICLNQNYTYKKITLNDSLIIKGKDEIISIKENQKEALITENKNLSSDLKKTKRKYKFTALSLLTTTVASLTLYLSTFI